MHLTHKQIRITWTIVSGEVSLTSQKAWISKSADFEPKENLEFPIGWD